MSACAKHSFSLNIYEMIKEQQNAGVTDGFD